MDKKREKWRLAARQLGVHFSLRKLPYADTSKESDLFGAYTFIVGAADDSVGWTLVKVNFSHDLHCAQYWDWQSSTRPSSEKLTFLESALTDLPDEVKAVAGSAGGITVFWSEKGTDEDFEKISRFFEGFGKGLKV